MKTIILYATKYGAAAEIARRVAAYIDSATVHDLKHPAPNLTGYDCVIVGSSVYAGIFRKEARTFLSQSADVLPQKKLGLFVSGMSSGEAQKVFEVNVPKEVMQSAKAAVFLGGIFDPKKTNFLERFIMKIATKHSEYTDKIDNAKIKEFAELITNET